MLYGDAVKHEVTLALQKAQMHGSDIFGLGDCVRSKYPQLWKELQGSWNDTFKQLQIEVIVEGHVRRYGLISRPAIPSQR